MTNQTSARVLLAAGCLGLASTVGLAVWFDSPPARGEASAELVSAPVEPGKSAPPASPPAAPAPARETVAVSHAEREEACQREFDRAVSDKPIEFLRGRDVLSKAGKKALDGLAVVAKACAAMKIEIQGYTDNQGIRSANVRLSRKRAEAVKDYLVEQGLSGGLLSAVGFGPDSPVASNRTDSGRAKNRRIAFRVIRGESG